MTDMRPGRTTAETPSRDFRQEVTEEIIKLLESGVAPWQKPWDGHVFMPMNPTSDRPYRGGNALHLLAVGMKRGYGDPRWLTYKQASDHNWQVRKGEKGTQIEFWEIKRADKEDEKGEWSPDKDDGGNEPNDNNRRFIHRIYTVFNASQIDGIPPLEIKTHNNVDVIEAGERILANSGAKIEHDQVDRAYYSRTDDDIHLPRRELFKDTAGYYGTALHELAHWTGHPKRLNRPTLTESYRFGDPSYAKEELRAELTSIFLAAERGIPHDPERHAAYVASWIKALKDDKNEIFRAAQDASAAAEYILSLERGQDIDDPQKPRRSATFKERVTPARTEYCHR
jgi:antirestriction protein ArdC